MNAAIDHCSIGLGIWKWASNDENRKPDVVMACAGDVPTLETLAAVDFLRSRIPDLVVRLINVVDLMTLQPPSEHPHGMRDSEFSDADAKMFSILSKERALKDEIERSRKNN